MRIVRYKLINCVSWYQDLVPRWAGWLHNVIYGIHCPFLLASPASHSVWHVTSPGHLCSNPQGRHTTNKTATRAESLPRGWVYTSSIARETSRGGAPGHTQRRDNIFGPPLPLSPCARVRHNYLITPLMRWAMRISAAPGPGPDTAGADQWPPNAGDQWWVTTGHPGITESYQSFDWSFINLVSSCGSGHQCWL